MDISEAVCRDNSKFPMLWKCSKVIGNDLFVPPGVSQKRSLENWMFIELPRAAIVSRIRVAQVTRVMQSAIGCYPSRPSAESNSLSSEARAKLELSVL